MYKARGRDLAIILGWEWEICIQVKKQQLQQDMEWQTGSK